MEQQPQAVKTIKDGPVTTIILYRPQARNAVDGPTAVQLQEAFQAFEDDPESKIAVFYGEGGVLW